MPRSRLALPLICGALLAALALPALASENETHVGRFHFQKGTATVLLPVRPPLPSLAWDEHAHQGLHRVAFLEIPGLGDVPATLDDRTRSLNLPHFWVRRILVAQNRPGVVRVAVKASRPILLIPSLTHRHGHWTLRIRIVPATHRRVGDFRHL